METTIASPRLSKAFIVLLMFILFILFTFPNLGERSTEDENIAVRKEGDKMVVQLFRKPSSVSKSVKSDATRTPQSPRHTPAVRDADSKQPTLMQVGADSTRVRPRDTGDPIVMQGPEATRPRDAAPDPTTGRRYA